MSTSDIDWLEVRSAVREMELACASRLGESGIDDTTTGLFVDARYQGQGAWVTVPLGPSLDDDPLTQVTTAFDREYRRLYGTTPDHVSPELLTWRVRVRGPRPSPRISPLQLAAGVKLKDQRSVWFADTGYVITDVYDRYSLTSGSRFSGPAIVEERESTVVVGPGGHCQVAENGSILVEVRGS